MWFRLGSELACKESTSTPVMMGMMGAEATKATKATKARPLLTNEGTLEMTSDRPLDGGNGGGFGSNWVELG